MALKTSKEFWKEYYKQLYKHKFVEKNSTPPKVQTSMLEDEIEMLNSTDARMTLAGISGAQGSWAPSEDESTGRL
jgi:hypothetical protein